MDEDVSDQDKLNHTRSQSYRLLILRHRWLLDKTIYIIVQHHVFSRTLNMITNFPY